MSTVRVFEKPSVMLPSEVDARAIHAEREQLAAIGSACYELLDKYPPGGEEKEKIADAWSGLSKEIDRAQERLGYLQRRVSLAGLDLDNNISQQRPKCAHSNHPLIDNDYSDRHAKSSRVWEDLTELESQRPETQRELKVFSEVTSAFDEARDHARSRSFFRPDSRDKAYSNGFFGPDFCMEVPERNAELIERLLSTSDWLDRGLALNKKKNTKRRFFNDECVVVKKIYAEFTRGSEYHRRKILSFYLGLSSLPEDKRQYFVKVLAVGKNHIITENMRGGNLYEAVKDLTISQRYRIALDVARGLEVLHKMGVVHVDLKDSHVLLDEERKRAKLCGFDFTNLEESDTRAGTGDWMAPERLWCNGHQTFQNEVFSFGVLLFFMVTRKIPVEVYMEGGEVSDKFEKHLKKHDAHNFQGWFPKEFYKTVEDVAKSSKYEEKDPGGELRNLAAECLNLKPEKRPEIGEVVCRLAQMCTAMNTNAFERVHCSDVITASGRVSALTQRVRDEMLGLAEAFGRLTISRRELPSLRRRVEQFSTETLARVRTRVARQNINYLDVCDEDLLRKDPRRQVPLTDLECDRASSELGQRKQTQECLKSLEYCMGFFTTPLELIGSKKAAQLFSETQGFVFPQGTSGVIRNFTDRRISKPYTGCFVAEGSHSSVYKHHFEEFGGVAVKIDTRLPASTRGKLMSLYLSASKTPGFVELLAMNKHTEVYPLARNKSLQHVIKNGYIEKENVLRLVRSLAQALAGLHELGLIHGDVKPPNILVMDLAMGEVVLCDLETVRKSGEEVHTITRSYLAPEYREGHKLSFSADVFSFGVTVFTMLTDQEPQWFFRGRLDRSERKRFTTERTEESYYGCVEAGFEEEGDCLEELDPDGVLQTLIRDCLRFTPESRPDFATIVRRLSETPDVAPPA